MTPSDSNRIGITFGEVFDLYLELHARPFTKSWRNTESYWRRHCIRWEAVKVGEVNRLQIQRWVTELGDAKGRPTANRAFTVLASSLNWALRNDVVRLDHNPCKGIRMFRANYRERFLQPAEMAKFLTAVDTLQTDMREVFWLLLLTGARKSNVMAMRYSDINFSAGYWRVESDESKNGEPLIIVLSSRALDILRSRLARRKGDHDWVFPGRSKRGHLRWPRYAWRKVCEASGIPDLHIHDLRRTLGSYLAMSGASSFVIGKALGHKDPRSVAIYARLNLATVRTAIEGVTEDWLS